MNPIAERSGEVRRTVGVTIAATVVAATVSGAPSTLHSLLTRRPVLATVHAAATLVRGGGPSSTGPDHRPERPLLGDLVAGGIAHGVVSMFWGAVLARVLPPGRRAAWGAAAGVAIHVVDLGIVARLVPRLAPMRALPQVPQLGDHIAFGFTLGLLLDRWDPPVAPSSEQPADPQGAGQATSSRAAG